MLNQIEKEQVLVGFPNIKLSYENITHKKVCDADFMLAIPQGVKCFAWFTIYNDKNVCFIMELANKKISNIKIVTACFNSDLAYNTIIYGTTFNHSNNAFFTIEDLFYYKGKDVSRLNLGTKLGLIQNIMDNDMCQVSYNNSFVVFGLPIISNNFETLMIQIKQLKYKIDTIQFRYYNKIDNFYYMENQTEPQYNQTKPQYIRPQYNQTKPQYIRPQYIRPQYNRTGSQYIRPQYNQTGSQYIRPQYNQINQQNNQTGSQYIRPQYNQTSQQYNQQNNQVRPQNIRPQYNQVSKKEFVFKIKPDIQNDIYHLYCNDGTLYDVAYIPDFKTSVMMNKLFRNIKENNNLDALEESDDEEEFQNDKIDRFVFMDKSFNMTCAYNNKFRKWYPLRLDDKNTTIVDRKDLPPIC
jgi:hypothetical protein